jgi:outer membrane protein OmpU
MVNLEKLGDNSMKHILATTALLALSAGFASAEGHITLSGDARMGIIGADGADTAFTSRARVKFSMSGETDGGLGFGASFRADNAGGASGGTAGEVHISGAFGKLSMGDVDGAAQSAVGQVSGVGLTGLGDLNEIAYLAAGSGTPETAVLTGADPTALYEYSTGAFTGYISVTNPGEGPTNDFDTDAMAIGAKYATDTFTVALGYEQLDVVGGTLSVDHVVLGVSGTFGAVTAKAVYGQASANFTSDTNDQYSMSVDYAADALTVTAFFGKDFEDDDRYGVGAAYDLGGGASVVGGYADQEGASVFDLGLSFSF